MTHTPGPFAAQRAGCGAAAISSGITGPSPCPHPPTWAGLVYFPYPRPGETRWAFTCDHHRDHLTAPRRLLDRDRAELARRRERERAVLVDHARYVPDEPLARGAAARRLLQRAERLAAAADDRSCDDQRRVEGQPGAGGRGGVDS